MTDRTNHRVEEFSSTAEPIDEFGTAGHGDGQFELPSGIGVSASGVVSVVDTGNNRIEQFAEPSEPVFTVDTPPLSATTGVEYDYGFHAGGVPAPTYSLSGAPVWLAIENGYVNGTPPSGTPSFSYSVVATSSSGSVRVGPFSVTVSSP